VILLVGRSGFADLSARQARAVVVGTVFLVRHTAGLVSGPRGPVLVNVAVVLLAPDMISQRHFPPGSSPAGMDREV
jgi:hypothetical protein